MEDKIRKLLFEPLAKGTLSALVPDFTLELPGEQVAVPARLTCEDGQFKFTLHFMDAKPPAGLGRVPKKVLTTADQLTIRGQIEGEIAFECADVFPPTGSTTRSRGTSTIELSSSRMNLTPEGSDILTTAQLQARLGMPPDSGEPDTPDFHAHVIYHGPKLGMPNAGTEHVTKNDFLGEAAGSSMDTHVFSSTGYEGALIEKDNEMHLHIRSKGSAIPDPEGIRDIVDRIGRAVAFVMGFHPWPVYRQVRIDHQLLERWISPRLNLAQTYLAPVSRSLWFTYRLEPANPIYSIIPTITDGLGALPKAKQERLESLNRRSRSL